LAAVKTIRVNREVIPVPQGDILAELRKYDVAGNFIYVDVSPFTIVRMDNKSWAETLEYVKSLDFFLSAEELKIWQEEIDEELL
jgi:hypothetical protein